MYRYVCIRPWRQRESDCKAAGTPKIRYTDKRATTTTTTTRADIFFSTRCSGEKNLLMPAAAGSFSLDATLGLLATRWRLGRRGDSSAMRSAFVVSSCML